MNQSIRTWRIQRWALRIGINPGGQLRRAEKATHLWHAWGAWGWDSFHVGKVSWRKLSPGSPPVEEMARVQKASRGPGARMQKRQIMPRWLPAIWELAAEVSPADGFQLVDCSVSTCSCPGKRAHASHTAPLPCILIWDFRYMFRTRTRPGK